MSNSSTNKPLEIQQLKEKFAADGLYLSENTLTYLIDHQLVVISYEQHILFPLKPSDLKEGVHYYLVSGKWVFTEFYHLLRGHVVKTVADIVSMVIRSYPIFLKRL